MRRLTLPLLLAGTLAGCAPIPLWIVANGGVSSIDDHRHFANAPIAPAAQPLPLPVAAAPARLPQGITPDQLPAWMAQTGTVALLMVRRGELVTEHYAPGTQRDTLLTSFSMAKSVVSTLMGIAQAEGRLSVQDPITRWLPELRTNDPRFADIRLLDLLRMRSGIRFDEGYRSPMSEAARFYLGEYLPAEVAKLAIEGPPDTAYHYRSGDTQLLAMALERATGMPLARYAQERLWQPMGAAYPASWSLDHAGGTAKGFCCLNARAVDYARFGLLFLHQGRQAERQVVPADWVRDSTVAQDGLPGADEAARRNIEWRGRATPQAAFYAWQWRRAPVPGSQPPQPGSDFYAQGLYGQYVYVAPQTQTVVVRLGRFGGGVDWAAWLGAWAAATP